MRAGIGARRAGARDPRWWARAGSDHAGVHEKARGTASVAPERPARPVRGDSREVHPGRRRSVRLRGDLLGRLHGRGDRSLLSIRSGAGRGRDRNEPDAHPDGAAADPVRGEIQGGTWLAQPRQRHRLDGSRVGGELRAAVCHVTFVQSQSRHRPLRGRQQRSNRLHAKTSRSDFPPAPERSPPQQRPQPAVGTGRHAGT